MRINDVLIDDVGRYSLYDLIIGPRILVNEGLDSFL